MENTQADGNPTKLPYYMLDLATFWLSFGNPDNLKPTFIRHLIKINKLSVNEAVSLTPDQIDNFKPTFIRHLIKINKLSVNEAVSLTPDQIDNLQSTVIRSLINNGKLTVDTAMLFKEKSSASDLLQLMSKNELFKLTDTDFRFIATHFNAFKAIKDTAEHYADIYKMVKMGPEVLAEKIEENMPSLFAQKKRETGLHTQLSCMKIGNRP